MKICQKRWAGLPGWALMVLVCSFLLLAAGPVFATDTEEPTDTGGGDAQTPQATSGALLLTGYAVQKDGAVYTGSIVKGDKITLVLNIFDERVTNSDPQPSPNAVLNTASFSIAAQGDVTYSPLAAVTPEGWAYTITFNNLTYSGSGNTFTCNISYTGVVPPVPMETVSIPLNQCVEYKAPEQTPTPEPPTVTVKGTGFVLKDARYGDGEPIYAGNAFTLYATILATNGDYSVENVSVAFSPPEEMTFADGSSVVYVGTMSPGSSFPVSATLLPGANIQEGSYTIGINVNGVNQKTGDPVSATMTISMPVLQPERFEIFNATLPTDLMAGMDTGMGYGNVTLVNQGRGTVSNVSLDIVGEGLSQEGGKQYIGNVGGGEQKSTDVNLQADTPGTIDAKVVVTYENVRGEQKTLEYPFTVNVMDNGGGDIGLPGGPGVDYPVVDDSGANGDGAGAGLPVWAWILICAAVAAVVSVLLVRRHRKKMKAAEAALDDFPDDEDD